MTTSFFCEWEAEDGEAIPDSLEEAGNAKLLFTAVYEIDLHLDIDNLTDKKKICSALAHLDPASGASS